MHLVSSMALIPATEFGIGHVTFSSVWNAACGTTFRLNKNYVQTAEAYGAWCAGTGGTGIIQGEWAQVTFPSPVKIVQVTIKGRGNAPHNDQRVTSLQIMTTDLRTPKDPNDPRSGPKWEFVNDSQGSNHLIGNTDADTPKDFEVDPQNGGRVAQAIRLVPTSCNVHCSMRFEVYVQLL